MSSSYAVSSSTVATAPTSVFETIPEEVLPESIEMKEITTAGKTKQQQKKAHSSVATTTTNHTDQSIQRIVTPLFSIRHGVHLCWTTAQQQTGTEYPSNTI